MAVPKAVNRLTWLSVLFFVKFQSDSPLDVPIEIQEYAIF